MILRLTAYVPIGPLGLVAWTGLYLVLSLATDRLFGGPDGIAVIWPAGGVALYLVLKHGMRGFMPVFVGGALALAPSWKGPIEFSVNLLLVGASMAGAAAGWAGIRALAPKPEVFVRTRDMLTLLVAGTLPFALVAALTGTLFLAVVRGTPGPELVERFLAWFISDLTGAAIVAPFLMAWCERGDRGHTSPAVTGLLSLFFLAGLSTLIVDFPRDLEDATMSLLAGPVLAAAALTTHPRSFTGVLLATAILNLFVVVENEQQLSLLGRPIVTLLFVQLYLVSLAWTHLILYAALAENRRGLAERVNLGRHLSPNMVELIARLGRPFQEPRRQRATVLFCDLRNFTALSELAGPEATMELLREFHATMSQRVFAHGGTLDRYLGDGLMAVFGVPEPGKRDGLDAILCAFEMIKALDALNARRRAHTLDALQMGIGLHTGDVVFGDIGSENALSVTVVGDTVNAASRLQALCRDQDLVLIVSGETIAAARAQAGSQQEATLLARLSSIGEVELRGRRQKTKAFALPREQSCLLASLSQSTARL